MLSLNIKVSVKKDFIIKMIYLYIGRKSYIKRKKDFLEYMKIQVSIFGVDEESQFSSYFNSVSSKKDAEVLYRKWFPTEEEKQKDKEYFNEKKYHKSVMRLKS